MQREESPVMTTGLERIADKARCEPGRRLGRNLRQIHPNPTKTKLVEFGRYAQRHASKRGRKRPETIYFLVYLVLHSQSERQLSNWNAYGKVTSATRTHALAGPDAADAALANTRAGKPSQSNAPWSLCILRHCRKFSRNAAGPSSRGALLAQNVEQ